MKRLIVRWFFKFRLSQLATGRYIVTFRPPFRKDWWVIGCERFLSKTAAAARMEEIRKDGADLFDTIWNN